MKNELVVPLPLAKKIAKLGVEIESEHHWCFIEAHNSYEIDIGDERNSYPAYTLGELPSVLEAIGKVKGKNGVPVTAGNGKFTFIVDQEFVPELENWSLELQKGYVRGTKKGTKGRVRSFIHRIVIGKELQPGEMIDHVNGNRLDNRRCNLRIVDAKVNAQNRKRLKSGESRGTYFIRKTKRWASVVMLDYKKVTAGNFTTREEASKAAAELRKKLYGALYDRPEQDEWHVDHFLEICRLYCESPESAWSYLNNLLK